MSRDYKPYGEQYEPFICRKCFHKVDCSLGIKPPKNAPCKLWIKINKLAKEKEKQKKNAWSVS